MPKNYLLYDTYKNEEAAIFQNGPQNGMVCIIDMHGSGFGHLFRPGVTSMMKGLKLLQEGCPIELKAVHVLNTFPFVNIIMSMRVETESV